MNYDLGLIAAVLETGDMSRAVKAGIKSHMLSEEAQTYWDIISVHYDQFHNVPSPDFFKGMVPSYDHRPPSDPLEALAHEVKTRHLYARLQDSLQEVAELSTQDPWAAQRALSKVSEDLNLEVQLNSNDLIAGEDKARVLKTLEILKHNKGLLGLAWPWEYLNENTIGIMPGNFVYVYGREKSKKTWLLLFLALFWEGLGHKVLFVSREMSVEEIAWRLYPLRAKLNYVEMTKGNISTDGTITLEKAMDDLYEHKNLIVTEVEGGIAGLRAKIEQVNPSIVIHDYLKGVAEDEMGDKMNAKQDQYVARVADRIKNMARHYKIPIIGCGHANREGVKLKGKDSTEIGHSDHIARRADLVLRVINDDIRNWMALITVAGRNVQKFLSWTLDSSLDSHFGEFLATDTSWVDDVDKVDNASDKAKEDSPESKTAEQIKESVRSFKPRRT